MTSMEWKEFVIQTENEAVEAISNILNEFGANGVVIVDPTDLTKEKRAFYGELYELKAANYPEEGILVKAYFVHNSEWDEKLQAITEKITGLQAFNIDIGLNHVTIHDVKEEDWENEWKKYFKPLPITKNLTIVPSWETYEKKHDDEKIISIDPGMAFGTGTHPTTILSMEALEKMITQDDVILDVGSGSGVLSIGAILSGAQHVYAFDLDEVAVNSTRLNAELNQMQEKITTQSNDLLKGIRQQANMIVSNILADILLGLIDDAWDNLVDDGYFITSGIIASKQDLVKDALLKKGFHLVETNEMNNWISFIAQKKTR